MAEAGQIVLPVRIDDGGSRRQALGRLVVVEHDRVEAEPRRFGERLVARRAAIDRDEQARALPGEGADRLDIGAVAFDDAVGDVDEERHAAGAQELAEQRRAAGAVDVVVAEDRHRLAALDRVGEARRRGRPCPSCRCGSGMRSRRRGSRKPGAACTETPRPASTRARTSGTPCVCAIAVAMTARAASQRSCQGRPSTERVTLRKGRGSTEKTDSLTPRV